MGNCVQIAIPSTVVRDCKDLISEQLTKKAKLKADLSRLETETEKLSEKKEDVMKEVAAAECQPFVERLQIVDGWFKRVEAAKTKVGDLINTSKDQLPNPCFGGLCSKNLPESSCTFEEEVTKKLEEVATLRNEGEKFGLVAAETIQDDLVHGWPLEAVIGSETTFNQVWKFVEGEKVGVLGLYGLAGVGKSLLLKQINNQLLKAHGDFVVIWISVHGPLQLGEFQEMIAKQINLFNESWWSKSFKEKVSSICHVLSKRKYVLLLDDIRERVDLVEAGVPPPNLENKSKVVFTTRLCEVCHQMEADQRFKVECLTEEEAWELFKSKVGDSTLESHHQIPELARTLAKECGGLLLALVHVARGMAAKETPREWDHAIGVLRSSAYEFPGMEEKVFSVLKLSYDHLSSDAIRSCFEYCSLFPKGYIFSRRELIDYWNSEGFLDDKHGLQNDGYHKIGVLVNACLLEEVDTDCVKMHNVIHNMALWITTKPKEGTRNFYAQAGNGLTEMPVSGEWQKVKKMSVMDNRIENVTKFSTCPHLTTLFLNNNRFKEIVGGFFEAIPNLRVLNLSNNPDLIELPSEIACLVSLELLDVSNTGIKELPIGVKSLLRMMCLNLERTSQLQIIPQQFISGFPNLKVLRMLECGSSSMQAVEDIVLFSENAKFFEEELPSLKHLITLTITLKISHTFELFFSSKKLLSCTQSLKLQSLPNQQCLEARSADFKDLETLYVSDCKSLEDLKIDCSSDIQEPCGFRSLQTVIISSCVKLGELTWLILALELKILKVSCCSNMKIIIDEDKLCYIRDIPERMRRTIPYFSKLKSLELQGLENLDIIYKTTLPFQHLKEIKVSGCPNLKTLPLDSNSAQGGRTDIEGEREWWGRLVWKDAATQSVFSSCFKELKTLLLDSNSAQGGRTDIEGEQ